MTAGASVIVERIRGVLLQGSADRGALAGLAEEHATAVGRANTMLARCHRWVQRGCASEALSLAEAAELIPSAAALRLEGVREAWNELLHRAGLQAAPEVDVALLESLVATAGRQESMGPHLSAMRLAFLRRAPLPERLRTLHELADRDPRNPTWLEAVRRLEREALVALADAAREADRDADAALAARVIERLDAMQLRHDEHAELFGRVRRIADAQRLLGLQRQARECADALHAAAASMDMAALEAAASRWERLRAEGELGDSLLREAEGPLDLLRRERERAELASRRKDALDRLELALDQARGIDELTRLADAVDRLDTAWPASLRARLQDRRAQHDASRSRRRALSGLAVTMVSLALLAGGWWAYRAWTAERRFDDAIAESDRLLARGDLASAEGVLDAVAADPACAARPELAGARLRLSNARDRARAQESTADELVERLDRLAQTSKDPVEMEKVAREALGLVDAQPPARRDGVRAAATRLLAAAAVSRDRSLESSRGSLHALTERLEGVADPQRAAAGTSDRGAWSAAAEAYEAVARDARAAATTAAVQRDGQALAESLQALASDASRRASKARARADRIDLVRETLKRLEQSIDEQATADLWERLLREGGDVLAERGMLRACESARDAARAGLGVRAWRTTVVPAALAGRADVQRGIEALDWGDAATARTLDGALTRHLSEHPDTPYRPVAERLQALARRTVSVSGAETSIGSAARAALVASGYAGLLEQPFEGGRVIYRRGPVQAGGPWAMAIESKRDLAKDPAALATRKPLAVKALGAVRPWAGAAAVEQAVSDLQGADGRTSRDTVLRMLEELHRIRKSQTGEPLLLWHAMHDLWHIWLRCFADESDPDDAAAARWVRSLDGMNALLGEDPILLGTAEAGARTDDLRRQVNDQLSRGFDPARLIAAARRRDARMAEGVQPLAPLGVMMPADDGSLRLRVARPGQRGAVPAKEGDGWTMRPLRVEDGRAVWDGAAPEPPVTWPQVLFIPGGNR